MENPTSDAVPQEPAPLLRYTTWSDETGFHARFADTLSPGALAYGCRQKISAATELELRQEAVRNRIRIEAWESGRQLAAAELLNSTEDRAAPPAE